MLKWEKTEYAGGNIIFSATADDVAISIIPSLTTPVTWRLETSIPGVSFVLPQQEPDSATKVTDAADEALLKECDNQVSKLKNELETLENKRSKLAEREQQICDMVRATLPSANTGKKQSKNANPGQNSARKADAKRTKGAQIGYLIPDENSPFHGKNLAAARRAKKLTQEEAGKLLGIKRVTLSAIECGRNPIDERLILRFAALYGLSG